MAALFILGSSNAVPASNHDNTHLLLSTSKRNVLIDCSINPIVRLEKIGVSPNAVTDIILTHFHPDHVSGMPGYMMSMWIMGRREPVNIYGLDYTIDRFEKMMDLFGWKEWPDFYQVNFFRISEKENALVFEDDQTRITASPVVHFLPTICLRMDIKSENKSMVYSCDTEPCAAVQSISAGANILLHEASGPARGHSTAAEAAQIAEHAGVGTLYLIHYPTGRFAKKDLVAEAQAHFQGEVHLAYDLMKINLAAQI